MYYLVNSDDPIYDGYAEKGIYGNDNVIYGRLYTGTYLVDVIEAADYYKNLLIYHELLVDNRDIGWKMVFVFFF